MENGSCRYHYPRHFAETTQQGEDSYPIYRRRNDGRRVRIRGAVLDNRWVVPYNPYLLIRYNCHINIEVCSSIKAVKYLFKYIYKGHDRASIVIEAAEDDAVINEIREYRDARFISPPEAIWRISPPEAIPNTKSTYFSSVFSFCLKTSVSNYEFQETQKKKSLGVPTLMVCYVKGQPQEALYPVLKRIYSIQYELTDATSIQCK